MQPGWIGECGAEFGANSVIYRLCQTLYQRLQCFTGAVFPLVPLTNATLKLRKGAALNDQVWHSHELQNRGS